MPDRKLPSLRLALARMAQPPVSGRVELHVDGGICARIKPVHPLAHDFAWIPAGAPLTEAQEAVVAEAKYQLERLFAYRIDCHLVITVVEGVPQLPLEIAYVDSSQPPAPKPPRPPTGTRAA